MMIVPKVSLKRVTLFGVSMVMDHEDVRDFKKSFPDAKVTSYYKGRSRRPHEEPSGCINVPVAEYLRQTA